MSNSKLSTTTKNKISKQKIPSYDALMRYARVLGIRDIRTKIDPKTGLHAIIAVHETADEIGPAIGGCRIQEYQSANLALKDVLRLAYGMALKSAASNLPHGGAKAVILKPKKPFDRTALMDSFGRFVDEVGGKYITSMDVGTTVKDMDIIRQETQYVIGASTEKKVVDPTPYTALGVWRGIEAAVKFRLNRDSLEGIRIAIQGAGKAAYFLCQYLHQAGAKITICDTQAENLPRFQEEFGAAVVEPDAIYDVPCEVFSPCAIGSTINPNSIKRISAPIIAGAANNQLAHVKYIEALQYRNILYAPDYVINAGGVIAAALAYNQKTDDEILKAVNLIYPRLYNLFSEAQETKQPTTAVAVELARRFLQQSLEKKKKLKSK